MKRIGVIHISEKYYNLEDGALVSILLTKLQFVPMRVEYLHHSGKYELAGISPEFEPIYTGIETPTYDLGFTTDEDGYLIEISLTKAG
jgi:hypothetical protein